MDSVCGDCIHRKILELPDGHEETWCDEYMLSFMTNEGCWLYKRTEKEQVE